MVDKIMKNKVIKIIPKTNPAKVNNQTQIFLLSLFENMIYAIIANQMGDKITIKNIKKKM